MPPVPAVCACRGSFLSRVACIPRRVCRSNFLSGFCTSGIFRAYRNTMRICRYVCRVEAHVTTENTDILRKVVLLPNSIENLPLGRLARKPRPYLHARFRLCYCKALPVPALAPGPSMKRPPRSSSDYPSPNRVAMKKNENKYKRKEKEYTVRKFIIYSLDQELDFFARRKGKNKK